jgi:hypothetical protein
MQYQPGRLTSLMLGALSLALASCGEQPAQPDLTADQPVAAASAPAPDTWIPRVAAPVDRASVVTADVPNAAGQSILYVIGGSIADPARKA